MADQLNRPMHYLDAMELINVKRWREEDKEWERKWKVKPYSKPTVDTKSHRHGMPYLLDRDKEASIMHGIIRTDDTHWVRSVPALHREDVHYSMTEEEARERIKEFESGDLPYFVLEDYKAIVWWMTNMKEDLP